jgi:ribonuclease HII
MLNLAELRRRHVKGGRPLPRAIEQQLREDSRRGAQSLLAAIERQRHARRAEGQRLRHITSFERALWEQGVTRVAGVDEAGMSPLAGPVVAAAAVVPVGWRLARVDDSKKLDAATREALAAQIREEAVAWAIGRAEPHEIDDINIYRAGLLAMRRAVEGLDPQPEHLLIDARSLRELPIPQQALVRGDARCISIAAASILAKTTRDALMRELDEAHPGYGFARHKGYPVAMHLKALGELGPSPVHRRSFAPVREALGEVPEQRELFAST